MRGKFGFFAGSVIGRGAMAAALAAGLAGGAFAVGVAPAIAKEKAPKGGSYSKEFVAAAQPLQATMNKLDPLITALNAAPAGGKAAAQAAAVQVANEAVAQFPAVEAAVKTPQDKLTIGDWMQRVGILTSNNTLAQRGFQNLVDSGMLPADKVNTYKFYLGSYAEMNKDYPTATRVLGEVVAANFNDDRAAVILAQAYASQNQPTQALQALKSAADARRAASQPVPNDWYARANKIAYEAKLGPQSIEWVTMQVQDHPTPFNWLGAAQIVRQFGTFTPQESLDLGRLLTRSDGFKNDPKYVQREYVEYIEAASKTGLPAEVLAAANAGVSAGVLKTAGDPFVADALREGQAGASKDRAALAGDERAARAGADGKSALSAGDSFLAFGQAAKAEEMFELAVQKGGIDKDRALTRQGIAEIDAGKYAEAKTTLAQVTGARAPLAKLFWVLADQKSKGGAAAPAAAPAS